MAVDNAHKVRAGGRDWRMSPRAMAACGIPLVAAAAGYYVYSKDKRNQREGRARVRNEVTTHDPPSDALARK